MTTPTPRVLVPSDATKGEVFQVRTIISRTGLRHDKQGRVIPRKIINRFACLAGELACPQGGCGNSQPPLFALPGGGSTGGRCRVSQGQIPRTHSFLELTATKRSLLARRITDMTRT